jgi:hypothetical protein
MIMSIDIQQEEIVVFRPELSDDNNKLICEGEITVTLADGRKFSGYVDLELLED